MSEIIKQHEFRVVRQELSQSDVEARVRRIAALQKEKLALESDFTGLRKWIVPRLKAAIDPEDTPKEVEGAPRLSITEAHGLRTELLLRRKQKTAKVAAIKAEMEHLESVAAIKAEYRRVEVDLVMDHDKLEVAYFISGTNTEVDRRAMTSDERQTAFEDAAPKKKRGGKSAPETVQ